MTQQEWKQAAEYWEKKDTDSIKMDRDRLKQAIEEYIQANNTCALATGAGDFVRCTPIEYSYHDGCFWMFSEGGRKFEGLSQNLNVCLAIYDIGLIFGRLRAAGLPVIFSHIRRIHSPRCLPGRHR